MDSRDQSFFVILLPIGFDYPRFFLFHLDDFPYTIIFDLELFLIEDKELMARETRVFGINEDKMEIDSRVRPQ